MNISVKKQIVKNSKKIKNLKKLNNYLDNTWKNISNGSYNFANSIFFNLTTAISIPLDFFVGVVPIIGLFAASVFNFIAAVLSVKGVYKHKIVRKIFDKIQTKIDKKIEALDSQNYTFYSMSNKNVNEQSVKTKIQQEEKFLTDIVSDKETEKQEVKDEVNLIKKLYQIKVDLKKQECLSASQIEKINRKLDKEDVRDFIF